MVTPPTDPVSALLSHAWDLAGGAEADVLLSALIEHIDRTSSSTLDRQRRLRAAAQALLEEIHDREITQV